MNKAIECILHSIYILAIVMLILQISNLNNDLQSLTQKVSKLESSTVTITQHKQDMETCYAVTTAIVNGIKGEW